MLVFEDLEGDTDIFSGILGHDHVVDTPPLRSLVGMLQFNTILMDELFGSLFWIGRGLDFLRKNDACRRIGAHNINPCCRPGKTEICSNALIEHRIVSPCVGFADDDRDQGNGGFGPRKERLGSVAKDSLPFLRRTNPESRTIHEGDQGDVKEIAESYEPRQLVGGIIVQAAH